MPVCPFIRYALVTNAYSQAGVEAYLPSGYKVLHGYPLDCRKCGGSNIRKATVSWQCVSCGAEWQQERFAYVIGGRDEAGWTLDGYVIPRLASGLIIATEIDLSHPVMKEVPA